MLTYAASEQNFLCSSTKPVMTPSPTPPTPEKDAFPFVREGLKPSRLHPHPMPRNRFRLG